MKKLFTLFALTFLICTYTYAQEISVNRTEEYCEMRTKVKLLRSKVVAHVDYGTGDELLRDDQRKVIEFESSVGALNYMNSKGWELVNTRVLIDDGSSYTYYIMKRKL